MNTETIICKNCNSVNIRVTKYSAYCRDCHSEFERVTKKELFILIFSILGIAFTILIILSGIL